MKQEVTHVEQLGEHPDSVVKGSSMLINAHSTVYLLKICWLIICNSGQGECNRLDSGHTAISAIKYLYDLSPKCFGKQGSQLHDMTL